MATSAATPSRDLAIRLNSMDSAATKFVKRLFPDESVPDARKLNVLSTYLLSRGLFHIGTWPNLGPKLEHKVHTRVMKLYRDAAGEKWTGDDTNLSDQQVIEKHELVAPLNLVVLARLRESSHEGTRLLDSDSHGGKKVQE